VTPRFCLLTKCCSQLTHFFLGLFSLPHLLNLSRHFPAFPVPNDPLPPPFLRYKWKEVW